jgi:O-acetyl-ADP-ribose deacetylase (regulator of RNase III)
MDGDAWRTVNQSGIRGEECALWLDKHGWRPYVIIDDETDSYRWQPLVATNGNIGATAEDMKKVVGLWTQQKLEGPMQHGLRYAVGDMLNSPDVIVAHGCNAQGAMGSGAALAVIRRYPENKVAYQNRHRKTPLRLGEVVWYSTYDTTVNTPRIIANCITQEFAGSDGQKYVSYDAVRVSYEDVADIAIANGWNQFSTCMVGAGLAGGDWSILFDILEQVAIQKQVTITVWLLDWKTYYAVCAEYREFSWKHHRNQAVNPNRVFRSPPI